MPGMRLRRLVSYRRGPESTRRFAALYHDDDRGARAVAHLADRCRRRNRRRARVASHLAECGCRTRQRCRRVLAGPRCAAHSGRAVHPDLMADELTAVLDGNQVVVDLATYLRDGSRRFAAIVEPHREHRRCRQRVLPVAEPQPRCAPPWAHAVSCLPGAGLSRRTRGLARRRGGRTFPLNVQVGARRHRCRRCVGAARASARLSVGPRRRRARAGRAVRRSGGGVSASTR